MTPVEYLPSPDDVRQYRSEGYLVTPPLFDADTLAAVRHAIEARWEACNARIEASSEHGARAKADYSRVRPELPRLHAESELLSAFCRDPRLAVIAGQLIGEDVDLSWNQAYTKAPHGDPRTEIPWHQDGYYAEVDGPTYNCWVAISETTVENGTIVRAPQPSTLLPHEWDPKLLFYRCTIDEASAVPVELLPGQAFIFGGRVPHRSGRNVSGSNRVSYSISFSSPSARLSANGETFGDRVPVLRDGVPVCVTMTDYVRRGRDATHGGARIVEEIAVRAPRRTSTIRAELDAFESAVHAGDDERASRHLGRLLAILPESEEALGDLVRARARVDQLGRELDTVRGRDPRTERLLLERMLELDPGNESFRAELARISHRAG